VDADEVATISLAIGAHIDDVPVARCRQSPHLFGDVATSVGLLSGRVGFETHNLGQRHLSLLVRLRELLSNLSAPLENALQVLSDTSKYTKSDTIVLAPEVRTALQRTNHRLEPPEVDEVVGIYIAGADLSGLGRRFKVHRTTARRHLLQRGIALRSAEPAVNDHAAIWVARYESGVSTTKLAAEFGTYPNTIRRALLAAGVRMRSSSSREISADIPVGANRLDMPCATPSVDIDDFI
jgi:hypothetical protein